VRPGKVERSPKRDGCFEPVQGLARLVHHVAAVLSLAVIWGLAYLILACPPLGITEQFGLPGPWSGTLFMAGLVVVGLLIYCVSRAARRSQGANLD